MSKGAFYIYFKSKEALLLSVLHYYYERIFTRIQKIKTEHDVMLRFDFLDSGKDSFIVVVKD